MLPSSASPRRVALLSLLIAVASLPLVLAGPLEVGYQIHSQNDLRQWPQTLLKGGSDRELWMKVDMLYEPPEFCQNTAYPAVGRVNPATAHLGCFLLTHDAPAPMRPLPYNTSDDVLNMIVDPSPALAPYFAPESGRTISIALCAKFGGQVCDGSEQSNDFIALMDDFVARAQESVASLGLAVEFILDGAFTPSGTRNACLKDKWQPWNATFIFGSDPATAYTDNNATNGDSRFQINNMNIWGVVPSFSTQYGKFGLAQDPGRTPGNTYTKSYPFLIWEPADQYTLSEDTAIYLSGPRHNLDPQQGLRFAINIDPVQLQVYTGSLSGAAWNWPASTHIADETPKVAVWSQVPFAATLEDEPRMLNPEPQVLLTAYWSGELGSIQYRLDQFQYALAAPVAFARAAKTLPLPSRFGTPQAMLPSFRAIEPREQLRVGGQTQRTALFLADDAGNFAVVDVSDFSKAPVVEGALPLPPPVSNATGSFPYSRVAMAVNNTSYGETAVVDSSLTLLQATNDEQCAVLVRLFSLAPGDAETPVAIGIGDASSLGLCALSMDASEGVVPSDVSLSLVRLTPGSPSAKQECSAELAPGRGTDFVFVVAYSLSGRAYALHGCIASTSTVGESVLSLSSPPSFVAVGDSPSVSLALSPRAEAKADPFVLLTLSNSYCWTTELTNKRPEPALCDSVPHNQTGVLTYAYGSLAKFTALLERQGLLSPCDDTGLVHGSHDQGSSSFATLYAGPSDMAHRTDIAQWDLQVVEAHAGYQKASTRAARAVSGMQTGSAADSLTTVAAVPALSAAAARKASATLEAQQAGLWRSQVSTPASLLRAAQSPTDPVPSEECGEPTEHAGIVVDSWLLPFSA